jgi:hypothetical protein
MLSSAVLSLSPRYLRADHTAAVTRDTFSAMYPWAGGRASLADWALAIRANRGGSPVRLATLQSSMAHKAQLWHKGWDDCVAFLV